MDAINYSFKKAEGQITVFMIKKKPTEAEGEGRGTLNFEPNNFEFLFKLRFLSVDQQFLSWRQLTYVSGSLIQIISSHRAKQG